MRVPYLKSKKRNSSRITLLSVCQDHLFEITWRYRAEINIKYSSLKNEASKCTQSRDSSYLFIHASIILAVFCMNLALNQNLYVTYRTSIVMKFGTKWEFTIQIKEKIRKKSLQTYNRISFIGHHHLSGTIR